MRYSPVVIFTLFTLTPLIALAQSAASPILSETNADKNVAEARKEPASSKNAAIIRNRESGNTGAGAWRRTSRKPETILVFTASEFTSALSSAQPGDTILLSGAIHGGRFTTTR